MNIILIQIQNSKSFKPDCHASRDTCGTDNTRYDSRVGAHGHFICEKGGRIPDFDWPEGAMIPQEALPERSPIWRSGSSDFADSVQPPGGKNSCFP